LYTGINEFKKGYIVWKCGKIQILGDDTNKSEWHSSWNQE
jgi:hypothetical protein